MDWRRVLEEIRVGRVGVEASMLASRYGYRSYMVERYLRILGYNETIKLLESFEKPVKPAIRCNHLRIDCEKLVDRLENLGFKLERISWSIHGYRVVEEPPSPTIGSTHEYLKGYYYVYRDAAPLIPPLLMVEPGEHEEIFDACAAPGGKATHLAQLMDDQGLVIANDIALYRLAALISHVVRMGFRSIVVTWNDLRLLPNRVKKRFTKILVDAPCSAEGTIMIDKSRKTKTTQEDLARIVAREIELLDAGIKLLDEGGIVVYVTCSIAPEENEYVVSKVIEMNDNVVVIKPRKRLFDWDHGLDAYNGMEFHWSVRNCIRIWPHKHGMIGMTICVIEKTKK